MSELDAATLSACRHGDARAFEALVRAHQDAVFALCVALAGADAEDLAQETFVRVHRSIRSFDPAGPATLKTWILRIARHQCQDRARAARLRVERALAPGAEPPATEQSPEERALAADLGQRLRTAIAALPEEQRAVIALREWNGLEYEAIAALEGVPIGTVRSRLARAREALRAALAEDAAGRNQRACGR
ncbi:MAG TPA: sigma-70 family RNA polymerase sigma factor [Polyangia bacterium]|nr:sigma-70 family RNA polymerase sigma factor [Polyangia bacterium]